MNDDHMTRDLPPGTDLEDSEGTLAAQFDQLRMTDEADAFDRVLKEFANAGPEVRKVMNNLFVSLCGYSLPTLVERAHGGA